MNRNEKFSYDDDAVLIRDEITADEDYSTVQKAICGAMGVAMVVSFCKSAKARRIAKKQAKKLARRYR